MINRLVFFVFCTSLSVYSQQNTDKEKDTLQIQNLDEVVITGQINPQSVKKSVFEVKVITRNDIEKQAGNNLSDLLNQHLNLTIIPNSSTGKSQVELFGLDSKYFKILVDNIPLVNDEGLGNNTDLTQINLDDIERIEIVEGSMGVQYGSNAVSGIINIISKKSSSHRWEITPYIQEETIGSEYNLKDRGRHIQSIKIGHNFSEQIYGNVILTRNDFKGFFNDKKGKNYEENDRLRGYEWLPKEQLNGKALLYFNFEKIKLHYKFEWYDDNVFRYNTTVNPNYNPATQTTNPTANDDIFNTVRWYNHLNAFGKIGQKANYDISFSIQEQKRNIETFTYRFRTQAKENIQKTTYESRRVYYSKGSLNNFWSTDKFNLQFGYEFTITDGFGSALSGMFSENQKHRLESYDVFGTAEYVLNNHLSFQPGVRLLISPQFDPLAALSLSSKYLFNNGIEARLIIGTSPRTPSFDELYTHFVDINHDVRGNENLLPEKGYSAFAHVKKNFSFNENTIQWSPKLSGWYLTVQDRIELMIINNLPLQHQYENIDSFKSWGVSTDNRFVLDNFRFTLGFSFSGISKVLNSRTEFNDDFLYTLQSNASASYTIPKTHTVISAYYKYTGESHQYVQKQNENNETIIFKGTQKGFSWMDASAKQSFWKNRIELTLGIRNLFDILRIETTAVEGGAHSAPPTNIMLGYGRSYFMKLLYNLTF